MVFDDRKKKMWPGDLPGATTKIHTEYAPPNYVPVDRRSRHAILKSRVCLISTNKRLERERGLVCLTVSG